MQQTIYPGFIKGVVTAPASKSVMQRACAAALIRKGVTVLHNAGISADDTAALGIIEQLGASVRKVETGVEIISNGVHPVSNTIFCGESGLSARMFTSIAATSEKAITIDGEGSLKKRPFHFFETVFPALQVSVSSQNGSLPLHIQGPLQPETLSVDGSLSSQFLTGLLFAYAARGAHQKTIFVENLASKPYIDLSLQILQDFGLSVPENDNYKSFHFTKSDSGETQPRLDYTVEGDWSGAAFLLVAGAINGNVEVQGLNLNSVQADKAVLQALMQAGAVMSLQEKQIQIQKSALKPFHFNATECPDLFPPLVALAAYCNGKSVIEGAHRLTHKESDRAITLQHEFGKMGVEIMLQDDLMIINGGGKVNGGEVSSHNDHRIAMACAVAAIGASDEVVIDGAEAVHKSYPQFWNHLQSLSN